MMQNDVRTLCLVGDRFAGFAVHDRVSSLSSLVQSLHRGEHDDRSTVLLVHAGQGIGEYEWEYVRSVVRARNLQEHVLLRDRVPVLTPRSENHKHRAENALIADLERVHDRSFRARLRLHADNELLLDHQSGQHVQGMVVVEAARQMFLAVTERYHTSRRPRQRYYFVIDTLSTTFENFLFPLEATIVYEVRRADLGDPDRLFFDVVIAIEQAGRRAALCEISFTAFASEKLHGIEHRRADRAVGHHLAEAEPGTAVRVPVASGR